MAFTETTLIEISKSLWGNVLRAGVCFDLAWEGNQSSLVRDKLKDTYEAHSFNTLFNSLIADCLMSLLRAIDSQRGTKSICNFIEAARNTKFRDALLTQITSWPQFKWENRARIEEYLNNLLRIVELDFALLKKHEKSLNIMRNGFLAHSPLNGAKGKLPKFSEILISCAQAGLCSDAIRLLCAGTSVDTDEFRKVQRKYAVRFWQTFAAGLDVDDRYVDLRRQND